ncbi:MAG TPA: hypothetical protein PLY87_19970 [Planctomycetaceae bacterium]|nr:hypothetical protein [Planctomycetaceae bacterium]
MLCHPYPEPGPGQANPCAKTNPRSRARQEADVKPRFLTDAAPNLTAPNLALLFADDAATAESILARKRGIANFQSQCLELAEQSRELL